MTLLEFSLHRFNRLRLIIHGKKWYRILFRRFIDYRWADDPAWSQLSYHCLATRIQIQTKNGLVEFNRSFVASTFSSVLWTYFIIISGSSRSMIRFTRIERNHMEHCVDDVSLTRVSCGGLIRLQAEQKLWLLSATDQPAPSYPPAAVRQC